MPVAYYYQESPLRGRYAKGKAYNFGSWIGLLVQRDETPKMVTNVDLRSEYVVFTYEDGIKDFVLKNQQIYYR